MIHAINLWKNCFVERVPRSWSQRDESSRRSIESNIIFPVISRKGEIEMKKKSDSSKFFRVLLPSASVSGLGGTRETIPMDN